MFSYDEDFTSYQYLDVDLKLYERLLSDLEYKAKLVKALSISEDLKIFDEKVFLIYNLVIDDLQQVSFRDLESFKRLQNKKRLEYVIAKYNEKSQPNNLIDISQLKKK